MANKNIQIKTHNGTDWDSLYPRSKSEIVERSDGSTVEQGLSSAESNIEGLQTDKVDKVSGKQLSTNDYTDSDKQKVAGMNGVEVSTTEPTDTENIWFEELS